MGPFSTTSPESGCYRQWVEVRLDLQTWVGFWEEIEQPFGWREFERWQVWMGGRQTASFSQGYRLCREHGKGVFLTCVNSGDSSQVNRWTQPRGMGAA